MNAAFAFICRALLFFVLLALFIAFLIGTTPGLGFLIKLSNEFIPGKIEIKKLSGSLFDSATFQTLRYTNANMTLVARLGTLSLTTKQPYLLHLKATGVTLNGMPLGTFDGQMNTQRELQATLQWRETSWPIDPNHQIKSTSGQIKINGRGPNLTLTANALLASPPNTRIKAQGALHTQNITGELTVDIPSIDILKEFNSINPHIQAIATLHATLKASGTLQKPTLTGNLRLSKGQLSIPDLNLVLTPINALLETKDKHWQINGQLNHENKPLTLKGQGEFFPRLAGSLILHGENIPFIHTPEYLINLSPDLTFSFEPEIYRLTGRILVPEAHIKPMVFSDSVSLTDDAIFVSERKTLPLMNLSTHVALVMGQAVSLDVQGLHGLLEGAVLLDQKPKQPLNATGMLSLREGRYHAYGQNLIINDSRLVFAGPSIDNPTLHVRALRHVDQSDVAQAGSSQLFDFKSENLQNIAYGNNIKVGIDIHGRLKSPKVTLFSTPPTLSQADILSMLLLGKPANQASKSGGQLLVSAISALNLDSGSKGAALLQQLKSKINVDFDVQNNTATSLKTNSLKQGTAIGVGKALTKRLYLHYSIDLFQDNSNVLTLTYLLNQFFSIQVTTNDIGNGVDLLYTHQGVIE